MIFKRQIKIIIILQSTKYNCPATAHYFSLIKGNPYADVAGNISRQYLYFAEDFDLKIRITNNRKKVIGEK